jgi:hypothetical protein
MRTIPSKRGRGRRLLLMVALTAACGGTAKAGDPCNSNKDCEKGLVCCSGFYGQGTVCSKEDACPIS